MGFRYEMTAATHTGKVRDANEDSLRIVPALNLAVVADGMGGHNAGEVASRMSVDALCDFYEARCTAGQAEQGADHLLAEAFQWANREVYAASRRLEGCHGMGTTLLAAAFGAERVHVSHVGDCRMYRFAGQGSGERAGEKLEQLTADHTLAAALLAANPGRPVPAHSHHILQKALGLDSRCQADFFTTAPSAGEMYLLCSDGLCGVIDDDAIAAILSRNAGHLEACTDGLVGACLERGAPDNVSVILAWVRT